MTQFQTFTSANLKTMLKDLTGQDCNETVIIAVQKLLDVIHANNMASSSDFQGDSMHAHSTQSRDESNPQPSISIAIKDEVLLPIDNNDILVGEARRKVQGCLHSAIYDLYVYYNHSRRNYNVLFHVGEITPLEVAVIGKIGANAESFTISPFSDVLWSVRFDFVKFI